MAETAVFSLMAVMLALGLLALIPIHRARTVSIAAAYACTQFVSQAVDPEKAVAQAEAVGRRTIEAFWSGTVGAGYEISAWAAGTTGARGCRVTYRAPLLFGASFGLEPPGPRTVEFTSLAESWKADWP
ncbi:MAG TPA: hypothetical protein VMN57_01410 [Anaerolineales bacterium]|nr:hypothetical protein [Anaerolineales bacterium]